MKEYARQYYGTADDDDSYFTTRSSTESNEEEKKRGLDSTHGYTRIAPTVGILLYMLEGLLLVLAAFNPVWWKQMLALPGGNVITLDLGLYAVSASSRCDGMDTRMTKVMKRFVDGDPFGLSKFQSIGYFVKEGETIFDMAKNFCIFMVDHLDGNSLNETAIYFSSQKWLILIQNTVQNFFTECSYLSLLFTCMFLGQAITLSATLVGATTWTFFRRTIKIRRFTLMTSLYGFIFFSVLCLFYIAIRPTLPVNSLVAASILHLAPEIHSPNSYGSAFIILSFLGLLKISNILFGSFFYMSKRHCIDSLQYKKEIVQEQMRDVAARNRQFVSDNIKTYGMEYAQKELSPKARALEKMHKIEYGHID